MSLCGVEIDLCGASHLSNETYFRNWEGYKYPSTYLQPSSSSSFLSPPFLEAQELQDLPIPPPKLVDIRRIEGEGPDLHLHQAVLHFPLIHLRDPLLGFPLGKPSLLLYSLVVFVTDL